MQSSKRILAASVLTVLLFAGVVGAPMAEAKCHTDFCAGLPHHIEVYHRHSVDEPFDSPVEVMGDTVHHHIME